MAEDKIRIDKFSGEDFGWWKLQIEDYLYQKDLYAPLEGWKPEMAEVDPTAEAGWKILDRKALGAIRLGLTKKTGYHIAKAKTAKEAMDILTNIFEKPSTSNQVFLLKKLVNMKLSDRGSVAEHINSFTQVTGQLESAGINLDMKLQALLFLCSLPESYNTAVQGISSTMKDDLTLDDAVSSIMDEEMRRKVSGGDNFSASTSSTALAVENRGRSKSRGNFSGRGRSQSRGKRQVAKDECWFCHKTGHRRFQCEAYKKKQQDENQGANVVSDKSLLDNLCLSAGFDLTTDKWFIDSGASFHCTSQRDIFDDYASGDFGQVVVGNGHMCPIVGKGTVTVNISGGGRLVLRETRHIPELEKNLISTSKLDQEGLVITFGCGEWKITSGTRVVTKGKRTGTLYLLQ